MVFTTTTKLRLSGLSDPKMGFDLKGYRAGLVTIDGGSVPEVHGKRQQLLNDLHDLHLPALKSSLNQPQALLSGLMSPRFPAHQARRINAQLRGHLSLREPWPSAFGGKALRE
jgi:hypothetical protein